MVGGDTRAAKKRKYSHRQSQFTNGTLHVLELLDLSPHSQVYAPTPLQLERKPAFINKKGVHIRCGDDQGDSAATFICPSQTRLEGLSWGWSSSTTSLLAPKPKALLSLFPLDLPECPRLPPKSHTEDDAGQECRTSGSGYMYRKQCLFRTLNLKYVESVIVPLVWRTPFSAVGS
jgi:hypothetical protein